MMIEQFLSQELIDRLIAVGDRVSMTAWEVGDLTNQALEILRLTKATIIAGSRQDDGLLAYGRMDLYRDIGDLVGKSASMVRKYARVARVFGQETREEFEVLRFYHFAFAAGIAERDGLGTAERFLQSLIARFANDGRLPRLSELERVYGWMDGEMLEQDAETQEAAADGQPWRLAYGLLARAATLLFNVQDVLSPRVRELLDELLAELSEFVVE